MGRRAYSLLLCLPFLIAILLCSWLLAILFEHFSGHHNIFKTRSNLLADKPQYHNSGPPYPSDRAENLLIFVQISDIHISKFRYVDEIVPQLEEFCDVYLPIIQPKLVLVTGDLTDAKAKNNRMSQQYLEEWISYNKLIDKCKQRFNALWLDIPGNHDDFGLQNHHSKLNMYRQYGSSRLLYGQSGTYQYILHTSFGKYAFNAINLTPKPGPNRPFNFFGHVEKEDIKAMADMARVSYKYNMSIWFGHYPLSVITTPSQIRKIVQGGIAYLCGHLHTLGGLMPRMYARPNEGHLELEAGDWKESRRYRIIAIDHDIFSFVDVTFGSLPVILITNPKDARFQAAGREAFARTKNSSHIRFLVFGKHEIMKASVSVDGQMLCENSRHVRDSLFVCPWQPHRYSSGLHQIRVAVEDAHASTASTAMLFSLDGSMPLLDLIPAIIMLTDFCVLAKVIYFAVFLSVVISPLFLRVRLQSSRGLLCFLLSAIPRQIHAFAVQDHLFWPVFYYSLYLSIGPLFVGELVPGSTGFCFVHGIFTNGHWLPGSLTYIYGAIQIIGFNVPLMLYLGEMSLTRNTRQGRAHAATQGAKSKPRFVLYQTLFGFQLFCQLSFAQTIFTCYGLMSLILSPVSTWTIPFSIWLMYRSRI